MIAKVSLAAFKSSAAGSYERLHWRPRFERFSKSVCAVRPTHGRPAQR
jgi:hypothetical protein